MISSSFWYISLLSCREDMGAATFGHFGTYGEVSTYISVNISLSLESRPIEMHLFFIMIFHCY